MIVTLLSHGIKPEAFVPTLAYESEQTPLGEALEPAAIELIQKEYNLVASELKAMGYPVFRLPFADHPVRVPVNVCRYRNPENGNKVVMLGKYPYHLLAGGKDTPRSRVARLLLRLKDEADTWKRSGREEADRRFLVVIKNIWDDLTDIENQPNPIFEDQAKVFRSRGFEVVEVPMFAWGAGGIHCQTLH
jgi:hypothetical protein